MVFLGVFRVEVELGGRLPIPGRFQEELGSETLYIMALDGPCLGLFPEGEWRKIRSLATQPALRMPVELTAIDDQGGLQIPDRFLHYAELEGEALVFGVGTFLEVWTPEHAPRADDQGDSGRPPPDLWDRLDLSL